MRFWFFILKKKIGDTAPLILSLFRATFIKRPPPGVLLNKIFIQGCSTPRFRGLWGRGGGVINDPFAYVYACVGPFSH